MIRMGEKSSMNIAIVFAGGVGKRMKTKSKPKQFLNLFGDPIIVHTLRRFEACQKIDKIIVVMLRSYISYMNDIVEKYGLQKVTSVVPGGKTGQQSIFNGISEAKRLFGTEGNIVLIHDGVRPCFEDDLIDRCIEAVKNTVLQLAVSLRRKRRRR